MPTREETLIAECLAGRVDAFGELIRPYQDRLYNVLFRVTGSREDAVELLQDALIRAYRNLGSFQGEASFYTWLYRVAMNLALTRKRRQKVRAVSTEGGENGRPLDISDDPERTSPGRELEAADRRRLVERAMASLDEPHRAILVLKEVEGLRYEEIARVLELPIGTVRSRLHRARADLRDRLKPLLDAGML